MPPTAETAVSSPTNPRRNQGKILLWSILGVAALWVFVSNEVALLVDYPLYHAYRLQMILDRWLLIPHAIFGTFALVSGPFQFSTRLRQRNIRAHRLLGRLYVLSVYGAATMAFAIAYHRPLFPGTLTQGGVWILVTTLAWITAKNGHVNVHRQWVARSYAVTFTFISLRILSVWPAYWNLPDADNVIIIILATFASVLAADIIMNWREITTRRG